MEPPPAMTVEVGLGRRQARVLWGLAAGLVAVGLLIAVPALLGDRSLGALAGGSVFLVLGVLLGRWTPKLLRPRQLVVDDRGIRLLDGVGKPFAIEWTELVQVRASYARKPSPVRNPLTWGGITQDAGPDGSLPRSFGVSTYVRVDLVPADPGFLDRHPTMRGYQRSTGRPSPAPAGEPWSPDVGDQQAVLRVPFGDQPELLAGVDRALRAHAGDRYHEPVNEGLALGFRYS